MVNRTTGRGRACARASALRPRQAHGRRQRDCVRCHTASPRRSPRPCSEDGTCFRLPRATGTSGRCATATAVTSTSRRGHAPESQPRSRRRWLREHGVHAATERDLCSSCHSERSCAACHGVGTRPGACPRSWRSTDVKLAGLHRAGSALRCTPRKRARTPGSARPATARARASRATRRRTWLREDDDQPPPARLGEPWARRREHGSQARNRPDVVRWMPWRIRRAALRRLPSRRGPVETRMDRVREHKNRHTTCRAGSVTEPGSDGPDRRETCRRCGRAFAPKGSLVAFLLVACLVAAVVAGLTALRPPSRPEARRRMVPAEWAELPN